jgi:hypothetical protein
VLAIQSKLRAVAIATVYLQSDVANTRYTNNTVFPATHKRFIYIDDVSFKKT